ncbi:CENP-B protein, partial [Microbacterium laevaniformans OR221]
MDKLEPTFSEGWLSRFKKRHSIKHYTRHGEASSITVDVEEEMKALRTIAGEYDEEDIYNMDETGLFWKLSPSQGLSSGPRPGVKKDKTRITVVFCSNSSGTDRYKPWFIGNARTPRALRNINISTMGGVWRWNKKAWMTSIIMEDW